MPEKRPAWSNVVVCLVALACAATVNASVLPGHPHNSNREADPASWTHSLFGDLIDLVAQGVSPSPLYGSSPQTCPNTSCFFLQNNDNYLMQVSSPISQPAPSWPSNVQQYFFDIPGGHLRGKSRSVRLSLIYISCSPSETCQNLSSMALHILITYPDASSNKTQSLFNGTVSSVSQNLFTFMAPVATRHTITITYPHGDAAATLDLVYSIGLVWLESPPPWAVFLIALAILIILFTIAIIFLLLKGWIKARFFVKQRCVTITDKVASTSLKIE